MSVRFTTGKFPINPDVRDLSGLPWGCVVQPFLIENDFDPGNSLPISDEIARCDQCFAYINGYCTLERLSWKCSLCDAVNYFSDSNYKRYGNRAKVAALPEMTSKTLLLDVISSPAPNEVEDEDDEDFARDKYFDRPIYIAMVDTTGSEDFLELVRSSLTAALEALSPESLFGLVTFDEKVGLFDVRGATPVVKLISVPEKEAALDVDLIDVLPLKAFLAPVKLHKENIVTALESLKPGSQPIEESNFPDKKNESTEADRGQRGFGAAMEAVLRYCGADSESSFYQTRIFAFLAGLPDLGLGALIPRYAGNAAGLKTEDSKEGEAETEAETEALILLEQTEVYKAMAAQAVESGICIDLFPVTADYVDLASIKFLSVDTGGSILLYHSIEESSLPQDLYRLLSRSQAGNGVLRLRCSKQFQPIRAFGHFFPDSRYEGVYHVTCCDRFDSFAFDLDFTSKRGMDVSASNPTWLPTVQLAFQYTEFVEAEGKQGADGHKQADVIHGEFKRRLVVRTVQAPIAVNVQAIYESADTEVILSVLTHKVIAASLEEGVKEGRLLLRDWLVILTAQYNEHYSLAQFSKPMTVPQLDVAFSKCAQLQPLPRLMFSLLRNSLIRQAPEHVHPDVRVYLQCLYSSLNPTSLQRSVYPTLSSFFTPDKPAFPRHSLSRAALVTSGAPIFLLDTFTSLIVYYTAAAASIKDLPFPPPQSSLLRATVNKLKQDRSITPRLLMLQGGVDSSALFEQYLLEEQDVDGVQGSRGAGFVTFLEQIASDVRDYMK